MLLEAAHCRDIYLTECKLYEDAYSLTMERLSRPIPLASTSDEYTHEIHEHKLHSEKMEEKHRQLNFLYDKLDRETSARYSKHHYDLEKRSNDLQNRMIAQNLHSEYLLRIWQEYQIRLNDAHHQLNDIQKQVLSNQHLFQFQQIQSAFALYKVGN